MTSRPEPPWDVATVMAGLFCSVASATVCVFVWDFLLDLVAFDDGHWSRGLDVLGALVTVGVVWFIFVRHRSRLFAAGALVGMLLWAVFWAAVLYLTWFVPDA